MKTEIWKCISCGKEVEIKNRSSWKIDLSERCPCGGMWKFKEIK